MSLLRYVVVNVVGIVLRFVPWPCQTGLTEIGRPGRDSPVLVTCNYRLTVARVRRALRGIDAYLLVANSRGVNVWCAATGGLLTNHDVVSALKTSSIEERVDHRRVILPQLAATGVEAGVVARKTGWQVLWGPVYARDLPRFVEGGQTKTREMREVGFPWEQRVEMAAAWAFPISVVTTLILAVLWRQALLPSILAVWGLSLAVYLCFPLYERWLGSGARGSGAVLAGFVALWIVVMCGYIGCQYVLGGLTWAETVRWAMLTLAVLLVMGVDFLGSTPLYKSGLQEDRLLEVALEEERCKGVGYCKDVCPRDCYEVDLRLHKATMPRAARCVRCGACVVQCPCDALHFEDQKGGAIPPDTIRRFKLNLMGKRMER
jgi:NAD-dependent dihydropyrimidine dehydrogenase PreA subunit